jgi:hypothetical protein
MNINERVSIGVTRVSQLIEFLEKVKEERGDLAIWGVSEGGCCRHNIESATIEYENPRARTGLKLAIGEW